MTTQGWDDGAVDAWYRGPDSDEPENAGHIFEDDEEDDMELPILDEGCAWCGDTIPPSTHEGPPSLLFCSSECALSDAGLL
jgi:hypothetical protein